MFSKRRRIAIRVPCELHPPTATDADADHADAAIGSLAGVVRRDCRSEAKLRARGAQRASQLHSMPGPFAE